MRGLRHGALVAGVLLACALPAPPLVAQAIPIEEITSRRPDARIRSLPDVGPVSRAFSRSGLSELEMVLSVTFDARGRVTDARVIQGAASPLVDATVMQWARGVVVETNQPGQAMLPVIFRFDDAPGDPIAGKPLPPVPEDILRLARAAGFQRLSGNLVVQYRDGEVWEVSLDPGSGDDAIDEALLAWARGLPPLRHDGLVAVPLSEPLLPVVGVPKQKTP